MKNGLEFKPIVETKDTSNTILYDALEDLLAYMEVIVEEYFEDSRNKALEPSTYRALKRVQDAMDDVFGPQRERGTRCF